MSSNDHPGELSDLQVAAAGALLGQAVALFDKAFNLPPRRPEVVDLLTFRDVVAYFTDKHPGDPRIKAGALLSGSHPKGRLTFQVFLDEADKLCCDASGNPYGRRLIARRFDDELAARFGTKELLIFR
jgi:hypothetical protein